MFSHIMVGANNIEESKQFYDAVLTALGHKAGSYDEKGRCFYVTEQGVFAITKPINGEAACHANGGTIGFAAKSQADVDAFHNAGINNGGATCEEPPGIRQGTIGQIYLGYLRDPAGNKICAVHRLG